jgi:D-glycero-alpha-D-manno-heptose-7-phosphate kinase
MIISRTPFRVSLFGGGSDYPAWYRKNGGAVLGFAINRYCYISIRALPPFFEHRHRIVYSKIENVLTPDEIEHPAVRNILQKMGAPDGLEIHHDGDLPARSGLGSSSSFTVGLLNCMYALRGEMIGRKELATQAIDMEQNIIREHVGSQDQVWAAYGGMNRIKFNTDDSFIVDPVIVDPARRRALTGSLMLFFTGLSRYAHEVAEKKIANLGQRERHIRRMTEMVDQSLGILQDTTSDLRTIGEMLHESWQLKRELADAVSTPAIDDIYDTARAAGAVGGKLLGAGGGGFMALFVERDKQRAVRESLGKLIEVSYDVDTVGSRIVVYEPDGLENRM